MERAGLREDMKIEDFSGLEFDCSCGRRHRVETEAICVSPDAPVSMAAQVSRLSGGKPVLLVADENTWGASRGLLESALSREGIEPIRLIFPGVSEPVPDEALVGSVLIACPPDAACIIAVGSGTINDTCRYVSYRMGIPYVIFATAPSMDGYASTVSPLIVGGRKITYAAHGPAGIWADPGILASSPERLWRAGFGDILGKFTALADWRLARDLKGEYHCPKVESLVRRAVATCVGDLESGGALDAGHLMEALILSGLAMGLIGNSRPASGAEHHLAHFWEITALAEGRRHPLHGESVGAATAVSARLYALMRDYLPAGFESPDVSLIERLLSLAGCAASPRDLGIPREVFHQSLLRAMEIRDRFTILRFCDEKGRLSELADSLTGEMYR